MTDNVTITKFNEVWFYVECSTDIKYELNDHFQFEANNAKYHPLVKLGRWDGMIRMFNPQKSLLHIGLLPLLEDFCQAREYTLSFKNHPEFGSPVYVSVLPDQDVIDYVDSLDIHSGGNKITPYDYQYDAIKLGVLKRRAVCISATGSGKSLMIYGISRHTLSLGYKVLIICPTVQLTEQMASDFADYSSHNGWDAESNIHKIHSGKEKESNKSITISTWQSLLKMPAEYFNKFSCVICDEVHLASGKSITDIMEKCTDANIRLGFTGSLDKSLTNKLQIQALFGKITKVSSSRDLIDKGHLTEIKISAIMLDYSVNTKAALKLFLDKDKKTAYQREIKFLTAHEKRNKFISNLAASTKENTLVFFNLIEHGKTLFELIKEKAPDKKVYFIDGHVDVDIREEYREEIEARNDLVIVASSQTSATGVNFKNLHHIVFAAPTKSLVRVLQSIGRGLRKSKGKDIVKLYDIGDNLTKSKVKKNHTYNHFIERLAIYAKEDFSYKLIDLVIEK